jgi:hypothetical protein
MISEGIYVADNKKEFFAEAEILRRALSAKGLPTDR